jgi:hypothetical protein
LRHASRSEETDGHHLLSEADVNLLREGEGGALPRGVKFTARDLFKEPLDADEIRRLAA